VTTQRRAGDASSDLENQKNLAYHAHWEAAGEVKLILKRPENLQDSQSERPSKFRSGKTTDSGSHKAIDGCSAPLKKERKRKWIGTIQEEETLAATQVEKLVPGLAGSCAVGH